MSDNLPATTDAASAAVTESDALPQLDAYALLTKPTLELTDADVDAVIVDLRARRARHLASGKPDKPKPAAKAPALTKEAKADKKAEATASLLADIEWKL